MSGGFEEALRRAASQGLAVPLDGGLGTRLAARGNDVTSDLWSALVLRDSPEEARAAHLDFFRAGARAATTCSYQVSYDGFAAIGATPQEVDALLALSVDVARGARDDAGLGPDEAWVLASVGPFGAARADGSEYTGAYSDAAGDPVGVDELRRWHRRRLRVLAEAAPDALLCETIPSLDEARALSLELERVDAPAMLSFTVSATGLRSGESVREAGRIADAAPGVIAVGVNCSSADDATAALRELRSATELPLVVYPNSGETWHAETRSWSGEARPLASFVEEWRDLGARLIGGCCRVDVEGIGELSAAATR